MIMKEQSNKKEQQELQKELDEKRVSLRDIRFGIAGSKNRNVKNVKLIKKEIARIKTALRGNNYGK